MRYLTHVLSLSLALALPVGACCEEEVIQDRRVSFLNNDVEFLNNFLMNIEPGLFNQDWVREETLVSVHDIAKSYIRLAGYKDIDSCPVHFQQAQCLGSMGKLVLCNHSAVNNEVFSEPVLANMNRQELVYGIVDNLTIKKLNQLSYLIKLNLISGDPDDPPAVYRGLLRLDGDYNVLSESDKPTLHLFGPEGRRISFCMSNKVNPSRVKSAFKALLKPQNLMKSVGFVVETNPRHMAMIGLAARPGVKADYYMVSYEPMLDGDLGGVGVIKIQNYLKTWCETIELASSNLTDVWVGSDFIVRFGRDFDLSSEMHPIIFKVEPAARSGILWQIDWSQVDADCQMSFGEYGIAPLVEALKEPDNMTALMAVKKHCPYIRQAFSALCKAYIYKKFQASSTSSQQYSPPTDDLSEEDADQAELIDSEKAMAWALLRPTPHPLLNVAQNLPQVNQREEK